MSSTSSKSARKTVKKKSLRKRAVNKAGWATFVVLSLLGRLLTPATIKLLGNCLGSSVYRLSARYRRIALKNLSLVYEEEKGRAWVEKTARDVFRHFTTAVFEFFYLQDRPKKIVDGLVDMSGSEHIDSALAQGNGCILLTAHFGNWELVARKLVYMGYKVHAIARDSDDPHMTGIANRIRQSGGYNIFGRDDSMLGAFRALKKNEVLALLPDQNDWTGEFVEFFSRPACTATGVAALSLKSGAPIVPIFCRRENGVHYKATVYERLDFTPSDNYEADLIALTQMLTTRIEEEIRKTPSQWLWLHDRWRCTPEARASERK